ncbi:ComF family protein [Bifidobacterium choloepi]|uniref:ComF family protein n=1 Tax=Bifidobacterium choloepi TaxID=2614131 RepID=A0A6I5N691_9BIFI|nr:ComF family protein [Bifidobacterium choloepi]NEG69311.1 ComF family protein [Bifidobacterium choloepi]
MTSAVAGTTRILGATVRDLVFPRGCAGCDMPDEVLCPRCLELFGRDWSYPLPGTLAGCGFGAATYAGPVRDAILLWKDHGDEECDGVFGDILAALAADHVGRWLGDGQGQSVSRLLVVAAPSTPKSVRSRGRRQMDPLVGAVARRLSGDMTVRRLGIDVVAAPILAARDVRRKSVEASSVRQRAARLANRLVLRDLERFVPELSGNAGEVDSREDRAGRPTGDGGATVAVLVDDIVTTGATMRACTDVLTAAGIPVVTALSLAYAPPPDA